jgi:hypothetical protein
MVVRDISAVSPGEVKGRSPFHHDPRGAPHVMLPLCLGLCPLRQMQGEADTCPAFKHNWVRVLAQALGLAADEVRPVRLPLAGTRLRQLTVRHARELTSG